MALPRATEARRFYQSAWQRYEDAAFLLDAERTTGAVYLAGYAVECSMKALILSILPTKRRQEMVASFRGSRAHIFDWLKGQYLHGGGQPFPPRIAKSFSAVNTSDTELRYQPGTLRPRDAEQFLADVGNLIRWADGRL